MIMTVSHSTKPEAPEVRMFPALRTLERQTPPLKYGRQPYWRAPVTPPSAEVYTPSWNWVSVHDFPDGKPVTVLDVNGAYLSALSGVKIAHSHLVHTGAPAVPPGPREVAPGYYRITVPYWAFSGTIVHPLGDSTRVETETTLWVAAPVLQLLLELTEEGALGWFEILDSWTAEVTADFRSWAERLLSVRTECLDRIEAARDQDQRDRELERYDAFKQGYSAALSMMLTGERCATRRPDWTHTVHAAHVVNTWRKAWRFTYTGRPLVAMGAVDSISILSEDLGEALGRPKPPFRYDATGRTMGAFKPKKSTVTGADTAFTTGPAVLAGHDQEDDVL